MVVEEEMGPMGDVTGADLILTRSIFSAVTLEREGGTEEGREGVRARKGGGRRRGREAGRQGGREGEH